MLGDATCHELTETTPTFGCGAQATPRALPVRPTTQQVPEFRDSCHLDVPPVIFSTWNGVERSGAALRFRRVI
jgi:hypothetical protein